LQLLKGFGNNGQALFVRGLKEYGLGIVTKHLVVVLLCKDIDIYFYESYNISGQLENKKRPY
jgi:hypothetical protein